MSVEHLEFIALFQQPFDGAGQGIFHVLFRFQGIVERDDGAVACIFLHLGKYLPAVQPFAVVAGYKIPHHDAVFPFQDHILQPSHVSVRRSEQIRMEIGVGFVGIGQIVPAQVFESADMIEGVVADAVPSFDYHPELFRMLAYIVSHHEEGCLDVIFVQQVQYPGSYLRDRAVIEGQVNGFYLLVHAPEGTGIKPAYDLRGLFYQHFI